MRSALPKVLHPIANRPMIEHVLAALAPLAPARTVVVVAPGMDAVRRPSRRRRLRDPARAARHRRCGRARRESALEDFAGDVLVLYGDTPLVTTATLETLLAERRRAPAAAGRARHAAGRSRRLWPAGRRRGRHARGDRRGARCDAERARYRLRQFRPDGVDGGKLFALLDGVDRNNAKSEYYLTDIVALARAARPARAARSRRRPKNAGRQRPRRAGGRPRRRCSAGCAPQRWKTGVTLLAPETVFLAADTRIGRDSVVGPFVVFGPGVTVGEGVEIPAFCHISKARRSATARVIGPFARLRPGAELGEDVHIGNFVEVKNSRLDAGRQGQPSGLYRRRAPSARGTNVGAGTITCNYDGVDKHPHRDRRGRVRRHQCRRWWRR